LARIRTIKPEFFTSLTIADLTIEARLTFIGLWTHVDDEGRCVDDARLIKAAVWPLDDRTATDVEKDLGALSESSLILRYTVGGRSYIAIRSWSEHQKINRPTKSRLPGPDQHDPPPPTSENPNSGNPHGELSESSLKAHPRKGTGNREQGKEQPPSAARAQAGARAREAPPAPNAAEPEPGPAERIVTAWRDSLDRPPPGSVVTAIGRHVAQMRHDGVPDTDIAAGLAEWQTRNTTGRGLGPGALPSVVHEVQSRAAAPPTTGALALVHGGATPTRPSTTDQRVAAGLALAAKYRAQEGGQP
jgi:hypothetical protein